VSECDALIAGELEQFVPEPDAQPNWSDVLVRERAAALPASHTRKPRRRLVIAAAAGVAALVVAAAVAAALGGFSAWLAGTPGRPAATGDQARFTTANGRSWAAFPANTKLRELVHVTAGGRRFTLLGFRSGSSICLRLKTTGLRGVPTDRDECAAASLVAHSSSPIVVIDSGSVLTDSHWWPRAQVSFGVTADGVDRVSVRARDGDHAAAVERNTFLWVEPDPISGNRVLSITATGRGMSASVKPAVAEAGYFVEPRQQLGGPSKPQAKIRHPKIAWFDRREPRGLSITQATLTEAQRRPLRGRGFVRLFKPDPLSDIVVGLGEGCIYVIDQGSGCGPRFFLRPFDLIITARGGESADLIGVVADGVKRIEVFLPHGQHQLAVLRDNVFLAVVPRSPLRVVAYNRAGKAVGVVERRVGLGRPAPRKALTTLRVVKTLVAPRGAKAAVLVGNSAAATPRDEEVRCWKITFTRAPSWTHCVPLPSLLLPRLYVDLVQSTGNDLFVVGESGKAVARVELHFADGGVVVTRPARGLFVAAIPRRYLRDELQKGYAIGIDHNGAHVQRGGFFFRTP
jgi:hypothetical protein